MCDVAAARWTLNKWAGCKANMTFERWQTIGKKLVEAVTAKHPDINLGDWAKTYEGTIREGGPIKVTAQGAHAITLTELGEDGQVVGIDVTTTEVILGEVALGGGPAGGPI